MSASEKLKRLEEAVAVFLPGGGTEAEAFRNGEEADVVLRRALPALIAVVEAAETEVANAQLVCDEEILLDRALASLDDALGEV